ncbi:MAG: MFS transporter [Candidatus Spechtbacterales bacterium]
MDKRILLLYGTVFINIMSFGMVFPLIPLFVEKFGATAFDIGLLAALFSIAQFIAAPIMGRVSDRFGRKPLIIFSIITAMASFVLTAIAPNLIVVHVARFLYGVASAGNYPIAIAYIADITSPEKRAEYIGKVSAMFAVGFMFGPVMGGVLGGFGLSVAFLAAAFVSLLNLIFVLTLLPESISIKTEKLVIRQGLFNIKEIYHGFRGDFGVLFFILFTWAFYVANFQVAIPLFLEEMFRLGPFGAGVFFSVVGATAAITQWFLLPKVLKRFGEMRTILYGIVLMILGQAFAPLLPFLVFFYFFFIISIIGSGLNRPTVNAMLSRATHAGQGATLGLAFSFESLGRIAGPLLAGAVMGTFGLASPFWLTTAMLVLTLFFFWRVEMRRGKLAPLL